MKLKREIIIEMPDEEFEQMDREKMKSFLHDVERKIQEEMEGVQEELQVYGRVRINLKPLAIG